MTHSVVQSDIELATQMIESDCVDIAIIACLCWRGVEQSEAIHVVDYLRRGRLQNLPSPILLNVAGRRRSRPARSSGHQRFAGSMPRSLKSERLLPGRRPLSWSRVARTLFNWSLGTSACLVVLSCILFVG